MSKEDDAYRRGLTGLPSGDRGTDYMNGVAEREKREQARRDANTPVRNPAPTPYTGPIFTDSPGQTRGRQFSSGPATPLPETLTAMAKSGASLFVVLFVGYTLLQDYWTWPGMLGGSVAYAVAGAIAGAALFIALKVLRIAVKIAFYLLIAGFVLHLLGVLDMWAVLARIGHAVGL
jgi:hypothetical protein